MREVALPQAPTGPYERLLGADRVAGLRSAAASLGAALRGRTIWHVNSTAAGGGVAEMLRAVLPLARAVGVDCRWLVTEGDAQAHALTKRLCLRLYGSAGDGGPLGEPDQRHYARACAADAARLRTRVRPGDVVVVHDPQPAGLVGPAREQGAAVVWRCHIGSDRPNEHTRQGWRFLRRHLEPAHRLVFSVRRHVPDWADHDRVRVIPPGVDPCSPKNMPLDEVVVTAVLRAAGLVAGAAGGPGDRPAEGPLAVPALDGPDIHVRHRARVWRDGEPPPAATPMVVQVSRWDRLKGMELALHAFAARDPGAPPACLTLAGPDPAGVADDPEGATVLDECRRAWAALPPRVRRTVQLACLPMADLRENALVVNALQRHATVVAQLSVAEGFGLTLTEAMWKARPVVTTGVGGLAEQVVPGRHGLVLPGDGGDVAGGAARAFDRLLADPQLARHLGDAARRRVAEQFLPDRQLRRWGALLTELVAATAPDLAAPDAVAPDRATPEARS